MNSLDVLVERARLPSPVRAIGAGVGLLPGMDHVVVPEAALIQELHEAHGTAVVLSPPDRRQLVETSYPLH